MRSDHPSGTVTFLFTDVEGSTRLLHSLGAEGYADALAEHRRVIREACAAEGGVEVDTQGDAFFFAFPTAPGALAAGSALHANDPRSWQLSQLLQWLHSAFARVRCCSLARPEAAANRRFERTGANRRERSPALASRRSWVRVPSSALLMKAPHRGAVWSGHETRDVAWQPDGDVRFRVRRGCVRIAERAAAA